MQQHHRLQMKLGCQESNLKPSSEPWGQTTEKLSFNKTKSINTTRSVRLYLTA